MHILSILFFSISSSSDNFVIGLSYGAKKITINFINNLIVALISCMGTFIAMLFGKMLSSFFYQAHSNIIGSLILILFGLYMLFNSFRKKADENTDPTKHHSYNDVLSHPEIVDKDNSKTIELKESFILGLILCLNNVGLGVGASITGLNIYLTSLSSLIFSIVFIQLGCFIGGRVLSKKLSSYSESISALIILLLGIYELFI